ncbi:MAG TPA: TetR/AcrR family transcriptional regulator [Rhizobacter sp.]
MSKTSPAAPTRQRRKEARPQELLDAALALFVEKGFAATRSDEVAVRAGVSKGTLYLYYPSKEELLKAVIQQNLGGVIAEGAGIVEQFEGPSAELLAMLMRMWWRRVGSSPAGGIHKIMMSEVRNFPEIAQFYRDEVIHPASELLVRTLRRGVERGEFRPLPYEHEETIHALIAPLIFLSLHKNSFGACPAEGLDLDPDRVVEVHIELMLNGLLSERTTTTTKAS